MPWSSPKAQVILKSYPPHCVKPALIRYLGGFVVGIPVFVFKSYYQSKLSLEWRQWMTQELLRDYFSDRTFYQLQVGVPNLNPLRRRHG